MISPEKIFTLLSSNGVSFFTGVPDSLLKDFCAYITDHAKGGEHVIASNEGNAVALACGHYLATGNPALVYMQNSGIGNAINPLVSLADKKVYGIPMLLVIGLRGEAGVPDEPQHAKQGIITTALLETLGIPYVMLPEIEEDAEASINTACVHVKKESTVCAIVVRAGTFSKYEKKPTEIRGDLLEREAALRLVLESIPHDAIIVSTTGKLSRELFELREARGEGHEKDFLTVGGMGHASQIALGIALAKPNRDIYCFDGDGAAIMHLGGWGIIGQCAPTNLKHIVFNNEAHDSVGGQPTAASTMNFLDIGKSCGYAPIQRVQTEKEIKEAVTKLRSTKGPALVEIRVRPGARKDLGRPTRTPVENKEDFMKFLHGDI